MHIKAGRLTETAYIIDDYAKRKRSKKKKNKSDLRVMVAIVRNKS